MTSPAPARSHWAAPITVAVVLGIMYVLFAPHTADLAAQTARSQVFRRSGYVPYWTGWYGGTPMAGYSLVTPPFLGLFGPVWLGALMIVAGGAVAVPLLAGCRRPRAAAIAVVVSGTFDVFSGRITFAAGVVVALAAVLAVERRRNWPAFVVAMLATATSPVAGVLLAVVAVATVLAGPRRRMAALAALIGIAVALVVIAILASGSRGGYEPFTRTSLVLSIGTTLVVILSPVGRRLRVVGWLTLWLLVGCFVIHSPIGANATRIAVLGAAPALVAVARWPKLVLVPSVLVASLLALGQLTNDMSASGGSVATRGFVEPLMDQLLAQPEIEQYRVEVVAPKTHWPLTYLLPDVAVARGWERQTDEARNSLFYGRAPLTAATYRDFLDRNAVGYVALPYRSALDYGSVGEAALIRAGLPYLSQMWSNANWRLYAVASPSPLVAKISDPAPAPTVNRSAVVPSAQVLAADDTGFTFDVDSAGRYLVRMTWSPYLVANDARVSRAPHDHVMVTIPSAGHYRLRAVWRWP
ncbi:MAG TPA: hypothetical protein VHV76_13325 [Mycobacteriales bacterium]|nr:hypothetical protein [Mycobacteriales bacterium]